MATQSNSLPDAMKAILAKLAVADLFSGDNPTVAEETALVRDLIEVCGEVIAFKALSTHKNDTYTDANGKAIYAGSYNNNPLNDNTMKTGQAMSPGQELALCMFIRANLSLSSILNVITYGQLIAYTHMITADVSEESLSLKLSLARRTQYDLHRQVIFGTTAAAINLAVFDSTSVSDLLYAVNVDGALTNSNSVYPQLSSSSATTKYLAKLWLLTKVTKPAHAIRTSSGLTGNYYAWSTAQSTVTSNNGTAITYTRTAISLSNNSTAGFSLKEVIDYIISTAKTPLTYKVDSVISNDTIYYLNGATSTVDGSLNGDNLLSSLTSLPKGVKSLVEFGLNTTQLRLIGVSLEDVYNYFATTATPLSAANAAAAGWKYDEIVDIYMFSDLTSNGTVFTFVPFSETNVTNNRKLVDAFLSIYQETIGQSTFVTNVNNRYRTLNQLASTTSVPVGSESQRIAVISYLLYAMQYNQTGTPADTTRPYTSAKETLDFAATLLPNVTPPISLKSLFHVAEAVGGTNSTSGPSRFNVNDLVNKFKCLPNEVRNKNVGGAFSYTDYNLGSNGTLVTSRYSWPESLVLNTWGGDEIFSASVTNSLGVSIYPVSIVNALRGSDGARAIIATNDSGVTYFKQNYDGIPYGTLVYRVGEAKVVADVHTSFSDLVGGITPSHTVLAAVFDALNLTSAQAKQYIGKSFGSTTVSLVTISMMANLSPSQRRAILGGIASAANQYSLAGLSTEQFLKLGYSSTEWSTYIKGGNLSVNVTLYDLLTLTEDVQVLDSDFYLSSTTVKRAVFHTKESRMELVRAFISGASLEDQEKLALAAFSDIPRP